MQQIRVASLSLAAPLSARDARVPPDENYLPRPERLLSILKQNVNVSSRAALLRGDGLSLTPFPPSRMTGGAVTCAD